MNLECDSNNIYFYFASMTKSLSVSRWRAKSFLIINLLNSCPSMWNIRIVPLELLITVEVTLIWFLRWFSSWSCLWFNLFMFSMKFSPSVAFKFQVIALKRVPGLWRIPRLILFVSMNIPENSFLIVYVICAKSDFNILLIMTKACWIAVKLRWTYSAHL